MLVHTFIVGFVACYFGAALVTFIALDSHEMPAAIADREDLSLRDARIGLACCCMVWPRVIWLLAKDASEQGWR